MTKDEMKNKISLALKDPILQQGFEIICKENATLKEDYECLEDAHNVLNELYEKLEKENAELKNRNQELLKSCEGATMMYKDLQKANEIIKKYLYIGVGGKITQNYLDVTKEAEQFLNENSTYERIQKAKYNYTD